MSLHVRIRKENRNEQENWFCWYWNDGKTQNVDVVNHSYLVARDGQFEMQSVEALSDDGQVIYTNEPIVAPGKQ